MLENLIDKFTRHLTVTNEVDEESFSLITKIAYKGDVLFSHEMPLDALFDLFCERLEEGSENICVTHYDEVTHHSSGH